MGLYEINFIMKGKAVREQKVMNSDNIEEFVNLMAAYGHIVEGVRDMNAPAVAIPAAVVHVDIEVEIIEEQPQAPFSATIEMPQEEASPVEAAIPEVEVLPEVMMPESEPVVNVTGPEEDLIAKALIDEPVLTPFSYEELIRQSEAEELKFREEPQEIDVDGLVWEPVAETVVVEKATVGRCPKVIELCRLCPNCWSCRFDI